MPTYMVVCWHALFVFAHLPHLCGDFSENAKMMKLHRKFLVENL